MNKKGFFAPFIAGIVLVLIIAMLFVQANEAKTRQSQDYQRAIFELKASMQAMQYVLDKATADAMADAITDYATCSTPIDFSSNVNSYFAHQITNAQANFGMQCEITPATLVVSNGVDFSFELKCTKMFVTKASVSINGATPAPVTRFSVSYAKTITFNKQVNASKDGVFCVVQVNDTQSGQCEVLQSNGFILDLSNCT